MVSISEDCISIGVELETILKVDTERCPHDPVSGFDVSDIKQQVREILAPISEELARRYPEIPPYEVVVYRQPEYSWCPENPEEEAKVEKEAEAHHTHHVQNYFVVGLDPSIRPEKCDSHLEFGVEISTPAFTNGAWEKAIPVMMKCLHDSGRFKFNLTTGLHVHLGKGTKNAFSFEELSRIGKATCLFEKRISCLHPERDPAGPLGLFYYKFCTKNSQLKDLSPKEMIELIDGIGNLGESSEQNIKKIQRVMNYPGSDFVAQEANSEKEYTCNLGSNDKFGTIEFRQAGATFDHERALNWIKTLTTFVLKACRTSNAEFLRMAEEGVLERDYGDFGLSI